MGLMGFPKEMFEQFLEWEWNILHSGSLEKMQWALRSVLNFLRGFGSFRLPSNTPIASLYAAIPVSGVLIALFTIEQIINGWQNGFDHPEPEQDAAHSAAFGATRLDRSQ